MQHRFNNMAAPMKILQFIEIEPKFDAISGVRKPEPRSGHRIVAEENCLYSIGGYNPDFWEVENDDDSYYPLFRELWKFNLSTRKWVKLKTSGTMPVELASHSAVILPSNQLLLFGGTGIPFGDAASNQIYACDLRKLSWKHVQCTGTPPTRGYGHSMTAVDNALYVFGGTTGWEYNGDLYKLDLCTLQWEKKDPVNGRQPAGRYRHEVAHSNGKLFVLGGGRATLVYTFEKIPVFDFEKNKWERWTTQADPSHGVPKARRCHSCVQYRQYAFLCGGYNGQTIYGDFWRLDLQTLNWWRIPTDMPQPSYFHSAAISPSGRMLLYGGVTKIDDVRTSNVYSVWLDPPSLREICWMYISLLIQDIDSVPRNTLLEMGVPQDLVHRLSS